MKPMDYHQFQKWIHSKGYVIGFTSKHHVIRDKAGNDIVRFAVSHKAGAKHFVKPVYIKDITKAIGP